MNFNEKLISLRKSKGLSQEELGAELNVSRQTISKWESCQSYPDFQRLVLLSDFFGLTLDELIKDIDVQEVREKNINEERLNSIYTDKENAKKNYQMGCHNRGRDCGNSSLFCNSADHCFRIKHRFLYIHL